MADNNDNFMREVEEEIRRERIEKIWREYGTYIIAGALLIVFAVLGRQYYVDRHTAAAEATGSRYEDALALANDNKQGSAAKEFEAITANGTGGYPSLSRLQLAGALLKDGKKAEALAAYEALAKDDKSEPLLRDYAALQAAAQRVGEADLRGDAGLAQPLLAADGAPWRYNARELLGLRH